MKRSDAKPRKARPAEPSFLSNAKNAFERQETAKKWREKLSYYVYDENFAHRLVRAGERYYKYDSNGNIICEQDGSFESNGEEDPYYKINQETEDVYSTDYGWGLFKEEDPNGGIKGSRYCRTYAWNERNQLISSVDANYSTAYVYGQDGQRSNKYTENSETLYFNKMWTHHTDSGNSVYGGQTAKNIYLGETRIVTKLNSGNEPKYQEEYWKQYYYHSDHLGSASLISDYKGDEYQRIEYTPYGETWVEKTDPKANLNFLPYKFIGKELDEEIGLYYYGNRYLDARYSRWISTDPALLAYVSGSTAGGGIYDFVNFNLYHYAGNNPICYKDPTGLSKDDWYDNGDGTWTAISSGAKLWDIYGADWEKESGFTRDPRTLQVGETVGKKTAQSVIGSDAPLEIKQQVTQGNTTASTLAAPVTQQSGWTRADTENVLSWVAVGLSVANGACMVLCPAACPFLIGGILIVDSINFGCKIADAKEEGLNLKTGAGLVTEFSSIVLDGIGFGIANNWIKSSSMLLNLRFNQGANRFIRANGRFIEGKIYWAIDYVGIPLFLGQF